MIYQMLRNWYLRVKEEFGKLGVKHNPSELAFFLAFQE